MGDWVFYLDADELVHEDDLEKIRNTMERYEDDDDVEALVFDTFLWKQKYICLWSWLGQKQESDEQKN